MLRSASTSSPIAMPGVISASSRSSRAPKARDTASAVSPPVSTSAAVGAASVMAWTTRASSAATAAAPGVSASTWWAMSVVTRTCPPRASATTASWMRTGADCVTRTHTAPDPVSASACARLARWAVPTTTSTPPTGPVGRRGPCGPGGPGRITSASARARPAEPMATAPSFRTRSAIWSSSSSVSASSRLTPSGKQPATDPGCFPEGVSLLDAETDEELDEIAERVLNEGAVAIGSAGLARALADVILPGPPGPQGPRRPTGPVAGVLVVVGTAHLASRAQALALTGSGAVCVLVTQSAPVRIQEAVVALARGGHVLVTTDIAHHVEADTPGAAAVAAELALVVQAITDAAPTAALVLTGGETALAVSRALGARELRLLAEITPGIAIGELVLADRSIAAITKSGGFGARDALLQAVTTLEVCA